MTLAETGHLDGRGPPLHKRTHPHRLRLAVSAVAVTGAVAATVLTAATPAAASGHCVDYTYSYGGYSTCIGYIQQLLNFTPIGPHLTIDNSFGSQTRQAVTNYQRTFRLKYVDGIVGPETWSQICSPQIGPGLPPTFPIAAARAAGCDVSAYS
jgi:zinc D-Ala-D-Ala carboxypeptidase